jgi:hypothetical protein
VDAEFEVAEGAAADAGEAGALQARQAERLGPQLDDEARERRRRLRAGEGALAQVGVAQSVAGQSVP